MSHTSSDYALTDNIDQQHLSFVLSSYILQSMFSYDHIFVQSSSMKVFNEFRLVFPLSIRELDDLN